MEEFVLSKDEMLFVIVPHFNPVKSKCRETLLLEFLERISLEPRVVPIVVQLAYPGQVHLNLARIVQGMFSDIRVHGQHVMFQKENLINIGLESVPRDCKYAWIDADVAFTNPHWVRDTLNALNETPVVQMFGTTADLSPDYDAFPSLTGMVKYSKVGGNSLDVHPVGLAWAAHKGVVPKLCDKAVLSGGDKFTWQALRGDKQTRLEPSFCDEWNAWGAQFGPVEIGYVPGTLLHYWHGSREHRQGRPERLKTECFKDVGFSVARDLKYNAFGVLEFVDPDCEVARRAKELFASRQDDSVESAKDESKI